MKFDLRRLVRPGILLPLIGGAFHSERSELTFPSVRFLRTVGLRSDESLCRIATIGVKIQLTHYDLTSSSLVRLLQLRNLNLLHFQHRLHDPLRLLTIGIAQHLAQNRRINLRPSRRIIFLCKNPRGRGPKAKPWRNQPALLAVGQFGFFDREQF